MASETVAARKIPPKKKKRSSLFFAREGIDMPLLILLMTILVIGLGCMLSASYVNAYYEEGDAYFYIRKQLGFAVLGLVGMFILSVVDYHIWHKLALPLMGIAVVLLVVVLAMPAEDGVQRWIQVPGIGGFQPSEVAKFALVVLFAHLISLNYNEMHKPKKGFWPFVIVLGIVCALMVAEPHLSGTILMISLGLVMMFVGGTDWKWLFGLVLIGLAGVCFMVLVLGYEQDRIEAWLHLEEVYKTNRDQAWQTMQSMYAIGSGGLLGQGFGNSRQKHLFLPEPQNDFVFAIVCEEFGFVGAIIIIALFVAFVIRGFSVAANAPDKFGFMLAVGLSAQIALQVAINIAVVSNLLPNTGISLPFFSYGGTSLVMLLGQMGVLLSISRQSVAKKNRG